MARVEQKGSQTVEYTANGITGQRIFRSLWAERFSVRPNIGEGFPGLLGLYCSRVRLKGFGKSIAAGGYTHCIITADYSSAPRALQQEEGHIEESIDISAEALMKGGGAWKSKDGEAVKEDDPATLVYVPKAVYTVRRTIFHIGPWIKGVLRFVGKVNSTTWKGGLPEKWLFEGATSRNFTDQNGDMLWVLTMSFIYRGPGPQTWNKVWRKDDSEKGGMEETIYFWDDKKLYDTADFNELVKTGRPSVIPMVGLT